MGRDKRLLSLRGKAAITYPLQSLDEIFNQVVVSLAEANADLPLGGHLVVFDAIPGAATMGGLYSALDWAQTDWVCAVACDMPTVQPALLQLLADHCSPSFDIVMPILAQGPQPMLACYRKACLPSLHRQILAQEFRLQALLDEPSLRVRRVTEAELVQADPLLRSFLNMNTPADFEMVEKLLRPSSTKSPN